MTDEFDDDEIEKPAGLPGWMATFADMMALLMCFFVLLLSYSQLDAQKFKRVAGAMKYAFGVQNEIELDQTPIGETPIFDHFIPKNGDPEPIPLIEQATVDSSQQYIDRSVRERIIADALETAYKQQLAQSQQANRHHMEQLACCDWASCCL